MQTKHKDPSIGTMFLITAFVLVLIFSFIIFIIGLVGIISNKEDLKLVEENSKTIEEMTCRIIKFYPEVSNDGFRTEYYCDVQNTDSGKYYRLKYPDFKIYQHPYVSDNFWEEVIQLEQGKIFTVKTVTGDENYRYLIDIVE